MEREACVRARGNERPLSHHRHEFDLSRGDQINRRKPPTVRKVEGMQPIKVVDLQRQHQNIKEPIEAAIRAVLDDCDFIMGRSVAEFELELCQYLGAKWAIGCASGSDALRIALMALDIGPGDEVITTPFTFAATAEAIVLQGARPVFVDIDPRTYNLDAGKISERITSRTKAILPVHLYGHPADMTPILSLASESGLRVIEDAAQALGAQYRGDFVGTLGDIGCLSFYPTKNLGACGDAGALLTDDPDLAQKCRMICLHGAGKKYQHEIPGINSRLDSLQAAILKVKLPYLEPWTQRRIRIAQQYDRALKPLPVTTPDCFPEVRHVYHQYSIRTSRRDELVRFLKARSIECAIHYPVPLHLQPAYRAWAQTGAPLPHAEAIAREILCLPMFPELTPAEVETVSNSVRDFWGVKG